MRFEEQKPGEKVIFLLKRHPAVLFRPALWLVLLTFLPIFAFIYFWLSWPFFIAFFFWLLFGGYYALKNWYCFNNSQYILTNLRLIDIDQKGILHKTVSEAPLEKIQDVSFEIKGFWPTLFEYGTVYAQTAGAIEKIKLKNVDEPKKIQEQISEVARGESKIPPSRKATADQPQAEKKEMDIQKDKRKKIEEDFWEES